LDCFQRSLLNQDDDDDDEVRDDRDDEQPTIVVLKDGDLTEEQVNAEKNGGGKYSSNLC
jgi:hypothetical protein